MSSVRISSLTKRFGGKTPTTAIDDLDLEIEEGEFLVLLGPSGCGKTTTLRCIAGLETADQGAISFSDRVVFDAAHGVNVPPNKRNIGMVFQSYALWPHMRVRKNIGYPLRVRRIDRATAATWIDEVAALVDCMPLLDRYPAQLSGGQQQRVALARGLVGRPELLLFDEPLSNLDARLRDQVRSEIHELHRRLGFTAVYVTHDQREALALGDRLAIMRAGALEQFGTPEEIFEEPATEYVADFIGISNRLLLERRDGAWLHGDAQLLGSLDAIADGAARVVARFRPEDVQLAPDGDPVPDGCVAVHASIVDAEYGGRSMDLTTAVGETRVQARVPAADRSSWERNLERGQLVSLRIEPSSLMLYDEAGALAAYPAKPARSASAA
jgi:iron(III) transport system ATP-binding protein